MKLNDTFFARGSVRPSLVDVRTGERMDFGTRHNTLSYTAADSMAAAFGGDPRYIPNRIGIVYGLENASFGTIGRSQDWVDLETYLRTEGDADVQVSPFCYSPSLSRVDRSDSSSSSSDESVYGGIPGGGNAVTFHMHSDSTTPGVFGTCGSSSQVFSADTYVYQALLLNRTGDDYYILARVSLDDGGTFYKKPENFEVALDWTVRFY